MTITVKCAGGVVKHLAFSKNVTVTCPTAKPKVHKHVHVHVKLRKTLSVRGK